MLETQVKTCVQRLSNATQRGRVLPGGGACLVALSALIPLLKSAERGKGVGGGEGAGEEVGDEVDPEDELIMRGLAEGLMQVCVSVCASVPVKQGLAYQQSMGH